MQYLKLRRPSGRLSYKESLSNNAWSKGEAEQLCRKLGPEVLSGDRSQYVIFVVQHEIRSIKH